MATVRKVYLMPIFLPYWHKGFDGVDEIRRKADETLRGAPRFMSNWTQNDWIAFYSRQLATKLQRRQPMAIDPERFFREMMGHGRHEAAFLEAWQRVAPHCKKMAQT